MPKQVTVQYRQLKTDGLNSTVELKNLLVDVLRRAKHGAEPLAAAARNRKIDLDQDGGYIILNKMSEPEHWDGKVFAGQLIHLHPGTQVQAVLQSLDSDAREFDLKQLDLGADTSILRGALYFAIVGNHVGLIEGQSVKGRTLERYLTRVFQDAAEFEAGQVVILNSRFGTADGKGPQSLSEVQIRSQPVPGPVLTPGSMGVDRILERQAASELDRGHTVFDVLRTLGWGQSEIDALKSTIPADGWIEGLFKVFVKQRNKRHMIPRAAIDEALRNIDPEDLGLKGDGSEKGGLVKLSALRTVQTIEQLLDPNDAMQQIVEALKVWARDGKIDCTF